MRLPVKMAVRVAQTIVLGNENFSLKESFEEKVKNRLGWSRNKWSETGEVDSKFHRTINSIRYWGGKLSKAFQNTNVVVGLYNEERETPLRLLDFIDEFVKIGVADKITGYNGFRNPKYLCFSFDTEETKLFVVENLKCLGASHVIYLHWALIPKANVVKMHWVPMEFPVEKLIAFVSKFGVIEEYIREEDRLLSGRGLKNGTVAFKIVLKDNIDIRNIPHLYEFDGLELLINITGRQILCLNCSALGHKSSECPTPYCRSCKKMCSKKHLCVVKNNVKTFAGVVSGSENSNLVDAIKEGAMGLNNKNLLAGLTKSDAVTGEKSFNSNGEDKEPISNRAAKEESEIISDGDSDKVIESDPELSESENSAALAMKEYCEELHRLRQEANNLKPRAVSLSTKDSKWKVKDDQSQAMDLDAAKLKRKIGETGEKPQKEIESPPFLVTYGRRGQGGRRRSNTQKSENLFMSMMEKHESKDLDNG